MSADDEHRSMLMKGLARAEEKDCAENVTYYRQELAAHATRSVYDLDT